MVQITKNSTLYNVQNVTKSAAKVMDVSMRDEIEQTTNEVINKAV